MNGTREIRPYCPNAGNPFHQCGDLCGTKSTSPAPATTSSVVGGTVVDANCVKASNPFHKCAEYCTKKTFDAKKHGDIGKSGRFLGPILKLSPRSSSKGSDLSLSGLSLEERNVDPTCVNASNPFHMCADYCTKKTTDASKQSDRVKTGVVQKHLMKSSPRSTSSEGSSSARNRESNKEEVRNMGVERKVDPLCVNASNPFHHCSAYCSQRSPDTKRRNNAQPLEALFARESEEVVTKENKEEKAIEEIRKVDPRCPNASNPFHKCADYCLPKISGSGQNGGGKPDGSKKKVNVVVEERDVPPRCVNASNPFKNVLNSSRDFTKKHS